VSLSPSELPFLATIADIDVPADIAQRLEALDAEAVRPQIYRGSRAWLDALSASAPLVLEFEDWHWADGASANLLRHVLPLVARRSLLVLIVTRPGASPPIGSLLAVERDGIAQRCSALTLGSLPQDDATALLDALVGSGIKEGRRRAAQDRAEGNPYFITELARFLQEQPDAGLALPDSIRAVVTSRVDRLDPDVRTSLRRAAVIGRTFTFALLERLGADARPALERLVQTGLVERVDQGATYRFAHALTRDAVYEGIPMSERRGLHGLIAETYRGHDGATAPDDLPALAYHLAKAERWDEAVEALTAAGEQAARLASDDEALDRYREAIRAHERLPEHRWSPLERSSIERRVAETLERLGRHEEAKAQVETALGRLGVRMPTARPAVRRALARQLLPRLLGPPALPAPGSRTDPADLEIDRQLDLLGFISYFLDADDYALATLMLTNRAVRARDVHGIAAGAVRAVFVFNALGRVRLTERYAQRAVEAAARLDDPVAVARILAQAGFHTFLARGSTDAIADLRRGMDAGERAGDLRSWGTAATLLSWAMTNAGQLEEAQSLAELIRDTGANGGERQVEGWGATTAGYVAFHAGRADEGLRLSTEGREILRSVPDILAALTVTGGIARDHLWLGDVEAARAELEAGREQAAATGIRGFAVAILNEAEAELRMLALARERTRANERAAASIVRRSRRHARTCRWHAVHAEAMDGCRSWLVGRHDRARTSFACFEKLVDELACEGIGSEARRWIVHCCQTAGIEPPTLVVGAQRRDGSRV
jgi:tetratricopeptide (TPR) repeat protein